MNRLEALLALGAVEAAARVRGDAAGGDGAWPPAVRSFVHDPVHSLSNSLSNICRGASE
jgi:hypothetical protein